MHGMTLLLLGMLGGGVTEYSRVLDAKKLDQAALDTEGYGEKKALKREDGGLRITLAPGEKETGWKTPQQLRIGGDFTITANFTIRKLPKPAQEDGAAVGLAIAFNNLDQPEVTLVRLVEPNGSSVYRSIEHTQNNPMQQQQMMMRGMFMQQGMKPPKPPRPTFPAAGDSIRFELQREGNTLRFQVLDGKTDKPRYIGQTTLGPNDIAAVKLFASNRNGAEAVNVLLQDITIRADRLTGLGTAVRTVFGEVVYADPTGIDHGILVLGGEPKAPAPAPAPANAPAQGGNPTAPAAATKPAQAPAAPKQQAATKKAEATKAGQAPEPAKVAAFPDDPFVPASPPKPKEPKARLALDELESIWFERTPGLTARFVGQPNVDFTMPGLSAKKEGETPTTDPKKPAADDVLAPPPGTTVAARIPKVDPKPNTIRDMHLALANLRNAAIRQVTVNGQTDKGPVGWRLDTVDSQDWPLVLRRSGTEPAADLFLEPPPGDYFQKDFTINVTYTDNQAGNATAKSNVHTDAKLVIDPKASSFLPFDAWVYLAGEEKLFGTLEQIGEESLRLLTPWQDKLEIPLARVTGVHLALPERKESPASFAKRLKARGSEDVLLAQTKDGEVVAIAGIVEGTDGDKLKFRYQDKSRSLPLKLVEGLIMAARPDSRVPAELMPTFSLPSGIAVSGRWKDLDTAIWSVETPWGQTLKLPAAEVLSVRFRGGKMTYLSDLKPSKVEETPFFGRRLPWRQNVNLLGEPLKMNGQTFERGLAVHSRCILTYDLDGAYTTFEALLGFDDAVKGVGRVECRVVADGKELYANLDLRADGPPVKLALPVSGAEQLQLRVDFGPGQDTGDRVIWANARLLRRPPTTVSAVAPR